MNGRGDGVRIAIEVSCVSLLYLLYGRENIHSEGWYFRPVNWGNRQPVRVERVGMILACGHEVYNKGWIYRCAGEHEVARVKSPLLRWLLPRLAISGIELRRRPAAHWRFPYLSEYPKPRYWNGNI